MTHTNSGRRAVAWWLVAGVLMIIVQTLLGGITRLTGSGLSITEWKPIMGALPPLSEVEWAIAFNKYKDIGQYKFLNSDFTINNFKFIFFWEWFHRLWARLLGVVFLIGFMFFLFKGYLHKSMIRPFIVLFLLGGLQGLIGWIMVKSGINDTELYVNHIKLSFHFVAAMILACYTFWFALKLLMPTDSILQKPSLRMSTITILILLFVQLTYGAFMAGLKAAMSAPTWPTINGMWLPSTLMHESLTNNKINVHFIHRGLAYLLLTAIIIWFIQAKKIAKGNVPFTIGVKATIALVSAQVVLGIVTVISAPKMVWGAFGIYEWLAEAHQLVAMFLLMSLVYNLFILTPVNAKLNVPAG
jgi:cytochrome c oxidase assembly protein subunit 15